MDRRSWTIEEDQAIRTLVQQFGVLDWTNISEKLKERYQIKERTGKQCRQRWYNHLNPEVNKKPWTNEEENQLFEIHRKFGNKWKLMSKYFEGRTDNDIKNHFYSTLRRSLRRLNKFIGQKNSTTQMRQIKPSVLSTIMNYIYQQQNSIQSNIVNSLKDLPYLIFEFSNYKPVKSKIKVEDDEEIKRKINFIFSLINSANLTYQNLKQMSRSSKVKKVSLAIVKDEGDDGLRVQRSDDFRCDLFKGEGNDGVDFIKYLPKKGYLQREKGQMHSSQLEQGIEATMMNHNNAKKGIRQSTRVRKSRQTRTNGSRQPHNSKQPHQKQQYIVKQQQQQQLLHTNLVPQQQQNQLPHHAQFLIKKQQDLDNQYHYSNMINSHCQYNQTHSNAKSKSNFGNGEFNEEMPQLRQRRISLQAYEEFMEDEPIGDLEQPSQISGFYCSGIEDLIVVGKQVVLHPGDHNDHQVKVEHFSSEQNIDELIEMNYEN